MSAVRQRLKTIRWDNGSAKPLTGVGQWELFEALYSMGFQGSYVEDFARETAPTLAKWLRQRPKAQRNATFVLLITYRSWKRKHWIVIRGNKFNDSHTENPCNLSEAPPRRKRVVKVWRIKTC